VRHFLCMIGWHQWKPTYLPWHEGADTLYRALFGPAEWTGWVCTHCRKRREKPEGGIDGNFD
jgi:hypothetical protein